MKRATMGSGQRGALVIAIAAIGCATSAIGCVSGGQTLPGGEDGRGREGAPEDTGKGPTTGGEDEPARVLGVHEIMAFAKEVGVPCERVANAAAMALAESGGDPAAVRERAASDACPGGDRARGLWGISACQFGHLYDDTCALDPACNAMAMGAITRSGSDWALWPSFVSGAYTAFLAEAEAAYAEGIPGCPAGGDPEPGKDPVPGGDDGGGDDGGGGVTEVMDCEALGYEGACVGEVSVWAEGGACRIRDCGAEGKACGWISDEVGWGCLGSTAGALTFNCGALGYTGACLSGTLVWEQGGACRAVHCPSRGESCIWAGSSVGYDCG